MANPITRINRQVPTEEEIREQEVERLVSGAAKSNPGLLMFMDIIQEMYEAGYLEVVHGMVKNREKVLPHVFDFIKISGMPVVMKNAVTGMQFLSTLEPHKVQRTMNAVGHGLNKALDTDTDEDQKGFFDLLKMMKDPDVNRSITMMLNFLKSMGEQLGNTPHEVNREMNQDKQEITDEV
ncbi:DUF1641 domain-containing protein [Paenibacillus dokdonensis]|uniref:DUF1641 domain-containing protein n=1 Tax=Paenibacillus dokdonensis TaxID=2567944 RepID=A0ABU6GRT0_9BACL|nr:DUF1641 domain-containing protein [Paenibacillus dokdonensis]MEC0242450.1 DUF1641 domain-containing protein [Paenibacillus dokdonensis]